MLTGGCRGAYGTGTMSDHEQDPRLRELAEAIGPERLAECRELLQMLVRDVRTRLLRDPRLLERIFTRASVGDELLLDLFSRAGSAAELITTLEQLRGGASLTLDLDLPIHRLVARQMRLRLKTSIRRKRDRRTPQPLPVQ